MVEDDAIIGKETVHGVDGFLQLLKEMEEKGEKKKPISGVLKGPFYSQAVYGGVVRIGIVRE
jgi:hypothetical protein